MTRVIEGDVSRFIYVVIGKLGNNRSPRMESFA